MPMQNNQPIPRRASKPTPTTTTTHAVPSLADELDEDERYYQPARMSTSTRRYMNTEGHEVLERGNKRMVIHRQPSPHDPSRMRSQRWRFLVLGMVAMLVLVLLSGWVVSTWNAHQIDATYGYPRTYQVDAVVGHNDSAEHPSHFLFLNLHGHVVIVEMPGGDVSHTRVYSGPTLLGPGADQVPITGSFEDRNGDGKPDMVADIQQQTIVYLNDGTQFKTQQ